MKNVFVLLALVLIPAVALGQGLPPTLESQSAIVDVLHNEVNIPSKTSNDDDLTAGYEIIVWATPNGNVLSLNPESIQFSSDNGGCYVAGQYSTPELFDILARAAVTQGVLYGYIPCMPEPVLTHVYMPACLQRTGTYCATRFYSCGPQYSDWTFQVACPYGPYQPQVTRIDSNCPPPCDAPCKVVCPTH